MDAIDTVRTISVTIELEVDVPQWMADHGMDDASAVGHHIGTHVADELDNSHSAISRVTVLASLPNLHIAPGEFDHILND